VRVPASSANLGPGFDSMGLALGVWDEYVVTVTSRPGLLIHLGPAAEPVPTDERHLVYNTMRRAWALLGATEPAGLELWCRNTIPHGRGLGSSAAAIVAGVAAAQGLTAADAALRAGAPPPRSPQPVELDLGFVNDLASELEGHPDNASASVYGGCTVSWIDPPEGGEDLRGTPAAWTSLPRVHTERLPLDRLVEPVVFVPAGQLPTATARAVLPAQVPHREAAWNSGRAALLTLALTARPDLLLPATREWLHQEQRRPCLGQAMDLVDSLRAGGHAAVISGAGPSVVVLATREQAAHAAALAPAGWAASRPGVSDMGVCVERGTFALLPGESDA
jgi:homoserine kinase